MICINGARRRRISFGFMARDSFFLVMSLVWQVILIAAALFVIL
jgi:hypothetical protein